MKQPLLSLALVLGLGLTACTDQPTPPTPAPTDLHTGPTTTAPASAPADVAQLPTQQDLQQLLTDQLPASQEDVITQAANEALVALGQRLVPPSADTEQPAACLPELTAPLEVAARATATAESQTDQATTTTLTALGFTDPLDAETLATQLYDAAGQCHDDESITTLTHHTDAAFEIRHHSPEATEVSLIIVANGPWVLATSSDPAVDVALGLTLIDQLDESLR